MERFIEKYVKNTINKDKITVELGLYNNGIYYPTTTKLDNDYGMGILIEIQNEIIKHQEKGNIERLEWMDYSTSKYQYLHVTKQDNIISPLETEAAKKTKKRAYTEIVKKQGDIICLRVLYESKSKTHRIDIFIANQASKLLKKRFMAKMDDQPVVVDKNDYLIINPTNLISIYDLENNLLIIKKPGTAKKLHGLAEYFETKANEILDRILVKNKQRKLTQAQIESVIRNESKYDVQKLNTHKDAFDKFMKKHEIGYIVENASSTDITESSITVNKQQLAELISVMPISIITDPISNESQEKLINAK